MRMYHGPGVAAFSFSSAPSVVSSMRRVQPSRAGAALVAEAAQVVALVLADVAIARNVDAVGPAAGVVVIVEAVDERAGADVEMMIHDVAAELAAVVAEAVRKAAATPSSA